MHRIGARTVYLMGALVVVALVWWFIPSEQCDALSPKGPRIGGVFHVSGC